MEQTLIIALHGFLGHPSDWTPWAKEIESSNADPHASPSTGFQCKALQYKALQCKTLQCIDLWNDPTLNSTLSLSDWTQAFLRFTQKALKSYQSVELWGYSLGGRLALGALVEAPELFSRGYLFSTNPGLQSEDERLARWERDLAWAQKFRTQPWDPLIQEWNQQAVFQTGSKGDSSVESSSLDPTSPLRREEEFSRERLALALENWSVSKQPNYRQALTKLPLPIEWHVGELDSAYVKMAHEIAPQNQFMTLKLHPGFGHRLLAR